MRVCLPAAVLLASGCTIAEKQVAADLACSELPTPATAPNSVTITGTVKTITGTPIGGGVMVQGFAGGLPLPAVTTDANSAFSYTQETAGVPNEHSIISTFPPFIPTITYPGVPIAGDTFVDVRMITMEDAMAFTTTAGIVVDPLLGVVLLRVTDCNESPMAGGTVSANPAGEVYYFRLAAPDLNATDTDASGIAMIVNLPPGDIELSGSVGDVPLRAHTVLSDPGAAFALTILRP